MNMEEAAQITGLSRATIFKEVKEGRLVSSRIGNRHLISMEDIERWLDNAKGKKTTRLFAAGKKR